MVVPDDQLSLAIGKAGQNARLAARLTGWHIDIKSTSYAGEPLAPAEDALIENEAPESDGFCEFVNADGVRCRNHARPNSKFCGIHGQEA